VPQRNASAEGSNLALLLHATNRLGEAESLYRPALAIFLIFQRNTGHPHPDRDAAIGNYDALLSAVGRGRGGIRLAVRDIHREAGLG
jgi:hypothetical protein